MLERISHDVFLGTLSRVINSFITRDKALRGTLCNSTLGKLGQNVTGCVARTITNRADGVVRRFVASSMSFLHLRHVVIRLNCCPFLAKSTAEFGA
jgi:hypothetical protein